MTKLFNVIAGFGAITVGIIGANIFWIPLLALFNFIGTYLKPETFMRTKRRMIKGQLIEQLRTFMSVYIFGVIMVSIYYGFGRLIGWLVNLI